jgi:hypothetical protein
LIDVSSDNYARQTDSVINLDEGPVWDLHVRVREMMLPMTAPADCIDMPASPMPTQQELDSQTKRWPGLFVWLWRFVVGGVRVEAESMGTDGGAEYARSVVEVILGREHRSLVESLSTGECSQIIAAYMGAQEKWLVATQRFAFAAAGKRLDRDQPAAAGSGSGSPAEGMKRVVPGGAIPMALNPQRHPMLVGNEAMNEENGDDQ